MPELHCNVVAVEMHSLRRLYVPSFMGDLTRARTICCIAIKFDEAVLLCSPTAGNSTADIYYLRFSISGKNLRVLQKKNARISPIKKSRI